jgi:ribosome-binding protein aMBF1 (putative translation factor)
VPFLPQTTQTPNGVTRFGPIATNPTPLDIVLAARVRAKRHTRGWSQDRLAQEMRRSGHRSWFQSTVNRIEHGERKIKWDEAVTLSVLIALDLDRPDAARPAV